MAILKDIEVRVVRKDTQEVLQEYDKPDSTVSTDEYAIEKYVEAKEGQDFEVHVFIREGFKCFAAWGVEVGINIDGGVVEFSYYYSKSEVERLQKSNKPTKFRSVLHSERSAHSEIGFRFGTLSSDENLEVTQPELEKQASSLGVIQAYIQRVNRKPRRRPMAAHPLFYRPLATLAVPKEIIKDKHVGSVMQAGEKTTAKVPQMQTHIYERPKDERRTRFTFRYRSEMHLRLLGCIARGLTPVASSLVVEEDSAPPHAAFEARENHESNKTASAKSKEIKGENTDSHPFGRVPRVAAPSTDVGELAEKVERLEKELKESQQQLKVSQDETNAMMQRFMGGLGTTMQALAPQTTTTAPAASPAGHNPGMKSKRIMEEKSIQTKDDDSASEGGSSDAIPSRPAKRSKTVIELD